MGQTNPSTPQHREFLAQQMLAHAGEYGFVSRLSRASGVSRPTLYAWRVLAQQALHRAFSPLPPPPPITPSLHHQVLTLFTAAHAAERGMQTCFQTFTQHGISLSTISAILHEAEQRALAWVQTHVPSSVRALAFDEIYANARDAAYLNVVDCHSGAVWGCEGPVPVDSDSWTLLLWELEARGVRCGRVVLDGGKAMLAACHQALPEVRVQHDQWHLLHACAQHQARLKRHLVTLEGKSAVVARQAARVVAGHKPKGRNPQTDVAAHAVALEQARRVVGDVHYLMREVHRLLEVVVEDERGLLTAAQRQVQLEAGLALLREVATSSAGAMESEVQQIVRRLEDRLAGVLTFVAGVEQVQQELGIVLSHEQQSLLGWAWLRRTMLGWSVQELVTAVPEGWRRAARVLVACWEDARLVRVSSAVERWHSIVRPHLAVHRVLSRGRLALLAVWHNHRVFTRGVHKGQSPLHLSGMVDAPTDWLLALGYPAADAAGVPQLPDPSAPVLAVAA
jgi:hypothetical protein